MKERLNNAQHQLTNAIAELRSPNTDDQLVYDWCEGALMQIMSLQKDVQLLSLFSTPPIALTKEDIQITIKGKEQQITSVQYNAIGNCHDVELKKTENA